jgi:hypothetical protein
MEFYAATEKNEMLSFAGKWMELENIILSEVRLFPSECPQCSPTKRSQASERGYCLDHRGWWITPEGNLFLPQSSQWKVLKIVYQTYHLGVHKPLSLARQLFEGLKLRDILQAIIRRCEICQHSSPLQHCPAYPWNSEAGDIPRGGLAA